MLEGMTFGRALRAARLGYGHCDRLKAFIRLGVLDGKRVKVSLVPYGQQVPSGGPNKHYVWWQPLADGPTAVDLMPALANVKRVKRKIEFVIDAATGERI